MLKPLRAALCAAPNLALAGLLLAACSGGAGNTADKIAAVITSPAGSSMINQIEMGFGPKVSGVIAKVNAGLKVVEQDKKYACAAMSMLNGVFEIAAGVGLVPASAVETEKAAMVAVNAACGGSVADVGSAVATVASAYINTAAALKDVGVPVTVPSVAAGS